MAITVDQLIPKIENALKAVRARSQQLGITLTKADVELSAERAWAAEGGFKVEFIVEVEAGASYKHSSGQTLSLTVTPKGGAVKLGDAETDELADAILGLASAIQKAASSSFAVKEGTVEIEFNVTKEGKLKVVVGGGGRDSKGSHKIKLTFKPSD